MIRKPVKRAFIADLYCCLLSGTCNTANYCEPWCTAPMPPDAMPVVSLRRGLAKEEELDWRIVKLERMEGLRAKEED